MKMRKAFDSTTVPDLPAGGDLYLGYVDGRYANVDAIRHRFPHRPVVRITVTGRTFDADMADVEAGDLTPASGALWAKGKLDRKQFPVLYFPESSRAAIIASLHALGVDPKHVGMFPAQYDGKAALNQPGDIGKQYLHGDKNNPGSYSGGHYDVSVVTGYWPGVDAAPKPRAAGFSVGTRAAIILATRQLRRRKKPLTVRAKARLVALQRAIDHALNLK